MDSKNNFPAHGQGTENEADATVRRREITQQIYDAILPLLGPQEAQELLQVFNSRLSPKLKTNLQPVTEQKCDLCQAPMKVEEDADNLHYVTSCTRCGYMDVLKK